MARSHLATSPFSFSSIGDRAFRFAFCLLRRSPDLLPGSHEILLFRPCNRGDGGPPPHGLRRRFHPEHADRPREKDGWQLLFDGKTFSGWHNFNKEGVRPGWAIKDGTLACIDPHNAGDLISPAEFTWFELQLDYNISEGGNSGIMYHVTTDGRAAWETGPEFQLEDNAKAGDPQRCGWLYALYQPPTDTQDRQAAGCHQARGAVESRRAW
jgi:hypothetical protein